MFDFLAKTLLNACDIVNYYHSHLTADSCFVCSVVVSIATI